MDQYMNEDARLAVAKRCAAELYKRGAIRVRLFGSLRYGVTPDALSDIDLAVEGLARETLLRTQRTFRWREGIKIDLVRLEDAPPGFRKSVQKGIVL
jgi:predicted nucleotidyltransferase